MPSLVSDFIINPVLRQARRLSEISRPASAGATENAVDPADPAAVPAHLLSPDAAENCPSIMDAAVIDRPTTSSPQPASVETPVSDDTEAWIYSGPPRRPTRPIETPPAPKALPEDDGMGVLRRRLLDIQTKEIAAVEKARLMHEALMEGYRNSQRESKTGSDGGAAVPPMPAGEAWEQSLSQGPLDSLKFWQHSPGDASSAPEKFLLTADDVKPTYAVVEGKLSTTVLGCQHYQRNVRLQCSTCNKWYTCRFCHDAAEDHALVRKETKNMLCMLCACPQRASDVCVNCGVAAARYFCGICKLWDDNPLKKIYHCNDCGICRKGMGLGKDFFHCKTCCACISISIMDSHKCIERSTDCNCPICGDYMFTSPKPLVFMPCGHSIHTKCYDQHSRTSYKCPICNKAFRNMESQFRSLDAAIQSQPMPPEFRDTRAVVLCNDCCAKSTTGYHWLGLKCVICNSYNTVELQILSGTASPAPSPPVVAPERTVRQEITFQLPVRARDNVEPAVPQQGQGSRPVRRRYSSHGSEARYDVDPRLARSMSPGRSTALSRAMASRSTEDSDEDILGLWHREVEEESASSARDSDESSDDSDFLPALDEEDEDDSDDDIQLIGHR